MYTTLKKISLLDVDKQLVSKLRKTNKGRERVKYYRILEVCGLPFALECTIAEPRYGKVWRYIAHEYAHHYARFCNGDIIDAIKLVSDNISGTASNEELESGFQKALSSLRADATHGEYYKAAVTCIMSAHKDPCTAIKWAALCSANKDGLRKEQEVIFYNVTKYLADSIM